MKRLFTIIDQFFFGQISVRGFGMMRMLWGLIIAVFMLTRWGDVTFLYSDSGLLTREISESILRNSYRISILDYITSPTPVFLVYCSLIISAIFAMLGKWCRASVIVTTLLLFSFHERNSLPLAGGDTVLRLIGFFLIIAPRIDAYSLDHVGKQWKQWKKNRTLLKPETMSCWVYRLALWQVIWIYISAGWDKVLGTMWWDGSATASALHHSHFNRFPMWVLDQLSIFSPLVSWATVLWQLFWAILFIPSPVWKRLTWGWISYHQVKRYLLYIGILFHGAILVFMEVGCFSLATMALYCSLLVQEDFDDLRRFWNRFWKKGSIVILNDDNCYLCRRTAFIFKLLDWFDRLEIVNFHHEASRKKHASHISFEDLDKAMHIRYHDHEEKGFNAFRILCWHLPLCWSLIPVLYIPGVSSIGHKIYEWVAHNRKKCGEECRV